MELTIEHAGDVAIFRVSGSLNTSTAPQLEKALEAAFSTGDLTSATFDFSNLNYISSAGLRLLMVTYKRTLALGGTMSVKGLSDDVMEVFEITGIADLLGI